MRLDELNALAMCKSLASALCPGCGGKKHPRHTFCGGCYSSLAFPLQRALYRGVGFGYEQAVAAAMQALGRTDFVMPPATTTTRSPRRSQGKLFNVSDYAKGGMPG